MRPSPWLRVHRTPERLQRSPADPEGVLCVDTPSHRPTLAAFRGELRKELRDRQSLPPSRVWRRGDPLNLIRVMPAKGRTLIPPRTRPEYRPQPEGYVHERPLSRHRRPEGHHRTDRRIAQG